MGYVQTSGGGSGYASPTVFRPFPAATTSGNTVVATVAHNVGPGNVLLTDSLGNAYVRLLEATAGTTVPTTLTMCYATNILGGSGHTITATFTPYNRAPAVDIVRCVAQEFTGTVTSERTAAQVGTATAATSAVTESTTQDRELVVGGLAVESTVDTTIDRVEPWVSMAFGAAKPCSYAQQHQETTSTGGQQTVFMVTPGQPWACGVTAFATPATPQPGAFFDFL